MPPCPCPIPSGPALRARASRCWLEALLLSVALALSVSAPAYAQVSNAALAESLFREGKRLMDEQRYADACPKFAESNRLDPGLGTLLNLALCHESEGKLATAWAEFSEAAAWAQRSGDTEREAFAREHVQALEPKLSRITLNLEAQANVPELLIKLDGKELSTAAVGVPIPIDPGIHEIEASAPGKQPFKQSIQIPTEPDDFGVSIPILQDQTPAGPPPGALTPPGSAAGKPEAPFGTGAASPAQSQSPTAPGVDRGPSGSNVGLVISGIATGALTAGAVITGIVYSNKKSDFDNANDLRLPDRYNKREDAQRMGIINLTLTGGAVVAAGLTVYFLLSGSSTSEPAPSTVAQAPSLSLQPSFSSDGASLSLSGTL